MSTISTYSRSLFMLGFQKQMVCFFSFHSDRVCISRKILECCLHKLDINILPQRLIQRVPSSRTSVKCQKKIWVLFFKANCRLNQVGSQRKHKLQLVWFYTSEIMYTLRSRPYIIGVSCAEINKLWWKLYQKKKSKHRVLWLY